MINQPLDNAAGAAFAPELHDQTPLKQPDQIGLAQRLWAGWVWLTGPNAASFGSDLASQERLRRSRLISALLVLLLAVLCFFTPSALAGYTLIWIQMLTMASCGVLVAALNRWGQVTLSALMMTLLADITLVQFILSLPNLNTTNLADLDLFAIAVLIGGILLPRWLILSTSAGQIAIIILLFYLKPHDPLLDAEIGKYEAGLGYAALTDSILLQICGASIAWLYAWSVERALLRANRAEELAEARTHISAQAQQIAAQKARLEHGITLLQEAQARVANGDYSARISLQNNELLPVAISFNLMAERLSRNERLEQAYRRLEQALQRLLETLMALGQDSVPIALPPTGTLVDRVFPYLARLKILMNTLSQSIPLAEDTLLTLQRQQNQLAHIESNLSNTLLLTKELTGVAAQAQTQPSPTTPLSRRLESSRNAEPPPDLSRLRLLLSHQTTLLEQTQRQCAYAQELSQHSTDTIRALGYTLKEAS